MAQCNWSMCPPAVFQPKAYSPSGVLQSNVVFIPAPPASAPFWRRHMPGWECGLLCAVLVAVLFGCLLAFGRRRRARRHLVRRHPFLAVCAYISLSVVVYAAGTKPQPPVVIPPKATRINLIRSGDKILPWDATMTNAVPKEAAR